MANFNRDAPETIRHPDIVHCLEVCRTISTDGIMTFEAFTSSAYMPFLTTSIILRYDADKHDFQYMYWGRKLTDIYGLELTNKFIADGDHKDTENPFIEAHQESMTERKHVFLGGTIDWRDKDYQQWNQVIMPLLRNDSIGETLTYVSFS